MLRLTRRLAQVHAKAQTDTGEVEEDEPGTGREGWLGQAQLSLFQKDLLEAMRLQGASPLQIFLKINSSGPRGRAPRASVVAGLREMQVLQIGEDGNTVDASMRERLLTALVDEAGGDDGFVTFSDFVRLCGGLEAKLTLERAAGAAAVVPGELAAEIAEVLVGKYGSLKAAFLALFQPKDGANSGARPEGAASARRLIKALANLLLARADQRFDMILNERSTQSEFARLLRRPFVPNKQFKRAERRLRISLRGSVGRASK